VALGVVAGAALGISQFAQHKNSLVWPAVQAVVGLGVAGVLWWRTQERPGSSSRRRGAGRLGAVVLLAVEAAFLLSTGAAYWSVSSTYFAPTKAVTDLQHIAGTSLVGLGVCPTHGRHADASELGIRPDANVGYGLREMVVYDPILPEAYLRSWAAVTGTHTAKALARLGIFCPRITTVDQALLYGVAYVLEPAGRAGPVGACPSASSATSGSTRFPAPRTPR